MIGDGEILWSERYRPKTIADCILPQKTKIALQSYVDKKEVPNILMKGSSGAGKTSAARALCEQTGTDYVLINGSVENGIDILRTKIQSFGSAVSFNGGRKVIIVDEADNLTNATQMGLRGVIEDLSLNCTFIFTCNYPNRIIEGIHSRCATIDFKIDSKEKSLMAISFLKRVIQILDHEKIKYDQEVLTLIIKKFFPDYRKILNELQKYSTHGTVDTGILEQISDANIDELVGYLKNKNFTSMRKWVALNSGEDPLAIMRHLYDKMGNLFINSSMPTLIELTAQYMFQAGFCMDQEINLAAYLTVVMRECEMK